MSRCRRLGTVVIVALMGAAILACAYGRQAASPPEGTSREVGVVARSKEVMPFDTATAVHTFEPTADGLIETVTNTEPIDAAQVQIIREHLAREAAAFQAGDFNDPARIHGDTMPGLAELRAGASALVVAYRDAPAGGVIDYSSADPTVVEALHQFGGAQAGDHGHEHGR